jgi:hypothetical protein
MQQQTQALQPKCKRLANAQLLADVLQGQGHQAQRRRSTIWHRTPLEAGVQLMSNAVGCHCFFLKAEHIW